MLFASIMEGDDKLKADSTIKYDPQRSVLKLNLGDQIALDANDFARITDAFFADLKKKFS